MRGEGMPEIAIRSFLRALEFVSSGGETTIPEATIEAVDTVPDLSGLDAFEEAGREALARAVVVKVNGGLGTSMGLSKAKSLLPIRPGITFLDLIARQVLSQRERWGVGLPLVLMNSYRTHADSIAALAAYPELDRGIPLGFVQHKVPRIDAESWTPIDWPEDRSLEWCPPGHGDIYIALASSGMLETLLSNGIRYAFLSNSDNLGAVLEPRILGWVASREIPFAMEVSERTASDKKGGHLARRDGRFMLREFGHCAEGEMDAYQDIETHHYFNTNNLWLDLEALSRKLETSPAGLDLSVICNEKRVSQQDGSSPRCYQLESAMGSAVECFEGAEAIEVPRDRFAPVKTTSDLLSLWSDAYHLSEEARMIPVDVAANRERSINLDPRFYGHVDDMAVRFPEGAPSLAKCRALSIRGDHRFGSDVAIEGCVQLVNESDIQVEIASGTVLSGEDESR
jgi:UTP--glucose-1-phosphate uridylyltransferase